MRYIQENMYLDRRTLEMDADAVAATNLIDNILMSYEKRKKKLEYIQIFSVEDLFELWGFSIACVFMKFELDIKSNFIIYNIFNK